MKKEVTITVSGEWGSGKSTIARTLVTMLQEAGFEIAGFEDGPERALNEQITERIFSADPEFVRIKIRTEQVPREARKL